ncbi:hypothetical protein [Catenulispora rubra]|uniref:hypothetical protein n=1 Tax=Catenulispora rubra TaxID=280293 RepID=UPI00189221BC|nr:hypothetical protein [Catenulispora rubra]
MRIAQVPVDSGIVGPVLEDSERERVAAFLAAGAPILMTTALSPDKLDPSRGKVVGASFRTDGTWIWSDTLTYYVRVHGLAPEDDLLVWIRGLNYRCTTPDKAAMDEALDALYASFSS